MGIRAFGPGWLAAVILAAAPLAAQTNADPRLFFTDLESGPVTGGEGDLGAFVTLFGEGFGPSRGSSKVMIGGKEVARYVLWGENNAPARAMDMIVVQPGPGVSTGAITVTVQGRVSNALPFTVRLGRIYFVDAGNPAANDQNPGSATQPFRTLYRPRDVLQAGDIVYIRGGNFTETDPAFPTWDTVLFLSLDVAASGTRDMPIAYVGYPGNTPVLGRQGARRILLLNQDSGPLSFYTIANLAFTAGLEPLPLSGTGHRIIGNRIFEAGFSDSGAIGVNGPSSDIRIRGNLLSRNGTAGEKLHHGFYPGGYGTNQDIEFGWNEVAEQRGGRGVQLYGHLPGDLMDAIRIHDNLIYGSESNNLVVGGSDGETDVIRSVQIYNNIVAGSRTEPGLRINTAGGTVFVQNNTLYGNAIAQIFVERAGAKGVTLRNNLVFAETGQAYIEFGEQGSSPQALASDHNLWFGSGPAPPWDAGAVSADPRLGNPKGMNFLPGEGSAAVDAGMESGVNFDFEGVSRPQGAGFDIGAHEQSRNVSTGRSLYFTRLVSRDAGSPAGGNEYTGIAVANLSGLDALLTFTALDRAGTTLSGAQVTNPRQLTLGAGRQLAQLDHQLLGEGLPRAGTVGWIRLDSSVRQVSGFFLMFDSQLSVLDGADVSSARMTDFVFPEIERLGTTELHLANPNLNPAAVTFELLDSDGTLLAPAVSRSINPLGALVAERGELFPGDMLPREGSIRVKATQGIVPFEVLRRGRRFVMGLAGQDAAAGSQVLYCPQYVDGGKVWRSAVTIVNLETREAGVAYRWIGDNGIQIGRARTARIRGRGKLSISEPGHFGNPADTQIQGYLEVISDGPRLAGSVIFGDQKQENYSTALPLVSSLEQDVVFSHLASNSVYYTGLAIANPNPSPARVLIEIHDAAGNQNGGVTVSIPPLGKTSQLLTQFFPRLASQNLSSGYIRVLSDRSVAAFALFGTHDGSVLSAIPPQVIR